MSDQNIEFKVSTDYKDVSVSIIRTKADETEDEKVIYLEKKEDFTLKWTFKYKTAVSIMKYGSASIAGALGAYGLKLASLI
ncbi:hypothetical protein [Methylobacterium sp. SyP6R]|uniref:hypothetical protein n=1 Tax=Methylobacterium sp. SyP6R TaxID=2718876 RepID=UPI001F4337DA|nr:hypothetical protein [Methylobacterium sp. SyP6R]MCF4130293.1 hypothetical protein [Methylobacterium sp. SyP6R]